MILSFIEGGSNFKYFTINFLTFLFSLLILVIVLKFYSVFIKKYISKIENITFYKGCNDFNIAYSLGFSLAKKTMYKFCNDSIISRQYKVD